MTDSLKSNPANPLRARILANLNNFNRRHQPKGDLIPAAVALILVEDDSGEDSFLITRRASHMSDHAGQWALPGGRLDPGESPIDAALRETREEVGLALPAISVLGLLDDYSTRSGFLITPVVIWLGEYTQLKPNPEEVASVHIVPLNTLDAENVPTLRSIPESNRPVISSPIPLVSDAIHAPTAAILYQLREVALRGLDTRVAHFEQPVFAWR